MMLLQVLAAIFGFFMLYFVRLHRKRNHIGAFESGAWSAIWGLFILVAIFPQTISGIAEDFHIGSLFDFLVGVGFMILTYLTFSNRIAYRTLERKLESMVRTNAINDAKKTTHSLHRHPQL
jgi:hypothetical protein